MSWLMLTLSDEDLRLYEEGEKANSLCATKIRSLTLGESGRHSKRKVINCILIFDGRKESKCKRDEAAREEKWVQEEHQAGQEPSQKSIDPG